MTKYLALFVALLLGVHADAQERKAYRHVDSAGNVTYSQLPPVGGKDTKKIDKVDIAPAHRGRGGSSGGSQYDNPRAANYGGQSSYNPYLQQAPRGPTAQEKRMAALKADCERQRGTDCNNPAALQYQESTSIPRRGRY